MIHFRKYTIVFIALFGLGCDSEPPFEDEYIGENGEYFRVKINREDWYPVKSLWGNGLQVQASVYSDGKVSINIHRYARPESKLFIEIDSFNGTGTYQLADTASKSFAVYVMYDEPHQNFWTDEKRTGQIVITEIDSLRELLKGTVSFDAASGSDIIQVREGSFIVRY